MNITIIGSGAIGTAIANVLTSKSNLNVTLLSIEADVIKSINKNNYNKKYFPSIKLHPKLTATDNREILKTADIVFLAIPSSEIVNYVLLNAEIINSNAILVNIAKGFGDNQKTIIQSLQNKCTNQIVSLKGPGFAREIISNMPTGLTLGSSNPELHSIFTSLFEGTCIHLDFSDDIIGVELSSILKNIYAIALGIIDAHFDSPNLRFLFLTNAFKEMKSLLTKFGGKQETMFKYCGFGDFGLTALNDLSRNRTLGLLIGKGFLTPDISDKVLLEGRIAVNIFCDEISRKNKLEDFHIISQLHKVFNENYDISLYIENIISD